MSRSSLQQHWPVVAIILCAAMLALLGGLQFVWTGRLSQAQETMMQNTLLTSLRQFEEEVERELITLLTMFQANGRAVEGSRWDELADRYTLWRETAAHPDLVSRLLVSLRRQDGTLELHELPPGTGEPVEAAWTGEIASLAETLRAAPGRGLRPRDFRLVRWTAHPEARAISRPLQNFNRVPRSLGRPLNNGLAGHLILVLDWSYVCGTMLPTYVDRFFSGPDGSRAYQVAVATRAGDRILFRSDPAIDTEWLPNVDGHKRLRLVRAPASRAQAAARESAEQQVSRRIQALGRGRLVFTGPRPGLELEIVAAHVAGSLEEAVQQQRRRNLAIGLGVIFLLGGAVALVLTSSRRASRLAKLQMDFVAGVTHELRTPLSVICSVGENLADGVVSGGERVRRYGELIRSQGMRLSEMVEQTLQSASLESGRRRFLLAPVDPSAAMRTALEQARPMIEAAGFEVSREEDDDLPPVNADEEAVQQILANLLSNALKYGEPGRWVGTSAKAGERGGKREVRISVRDHGKGIPPKEARRVFDPFYRCASAREESVEGSGLGLTLARDLARGMGGDLSFRSDPGKGSEFTLALPARTEAEA